MRSPFADVSSLLVLAVVAYVALAASPCAAQTRVTSTEDLRRALAVDDVVLVRSAPAQPVRGRLIRIGDSDLDIRPDARRRQARGSRDVTVRFDAIQWLERPRDSVRNGIALGAGIGAAIAGAFFVRALAVDRNEIDEWAGLYAGVAGVFTGAGALIGWGVDASRSKLYLRFDVASLAISF